MELASALPSEREFMQFQALLETRLGIHIPTQKRALLSNRLWKRLQARRLDSFRDYHRLITSPGEVAELNLALELLTTNETFFFREPRHFAFLKEVVLTQALRTQSLRIWSAACSTGEEPYSIAMVMQDLAKAPWEIIASDVNETVLAKAGKGIYLDNRMEYLPENYRQQYCRKGVDRWDGYLRIEPCLRAKVSFRHINLHQTLPNIGQFDVIFLRNVLIYFQGENKREVFNRVVERLRPGGWLMIGHSESMHGVHPQLRPVLPSIYRKEVSSHAAKPELP